MEFPEIMEKSWNLIWSEKSYGKQDFHEKVMGKSWNFFPWQTQLLTNLLAKFISIEIQNLLHKFWLIYYYFSTVWVMEKSGKSHRIFFPNFVATLIEHKIIVFLQIIFKSRIIFLDIIIYNYYNRIFLIRTCPNIFLAKIICVIADIVFYFMHLIFISWIRFYTLLFYYLVLSRIYLPSENRALRYCIY